MAFMGQIPIMRELGPGRDHIGWSNLCYSFIPFSRAVSWPPKSPGQPRLLCRSLAYMGLVMYVLLGLLPRSIANFLKGNLLLLAHSLNALLPCFCKNRFEKRTRALHHPPLLPFSLSSQGASLGSWSGRLRKSPRKQDGRNRQCLSLQNKR